MKHVDTSLYKYWIFSNDPKYEKNSFYQADINRELAEKWEKECDKRNEYFKKYGITIVTFTDTDLQDIGACFETIKNYLQKRPYVPCSLQDSINKLDDLMSKR